MRCVNCRVLIRRCTCGGQACPGWGHVLGAGVSRHWCPPDWKDQPHPDETEDAK